MCMLNVFLHDRKYGISLNALGMFASMELAEYAAACWLNCQYFVIVSRVFARLWKLKQAKNG